jgi:uncharacterized membrane protein YqiK
MKNQKFNPMEVKVINNQFVLIRNTQVVQSVEVGTFSSRFEVGEKARSMGFNFVKYSYEARALVAIDRERIKAAKAEVRATAKAAKLEARATAKAAKLAARTAKAEARATAKAAKLAAKAAKAEAKAQAKAEKLVARQLNKDAKLAAKAERARIKAAAKPKAKASKFESTIGSDGIERGVARRSDAYVEELV